MFFEEVIKYFQDNPIQLMIVGACVLLLVIGFIALAAISATAKRKKKLSTAQAETAVSSAPIEEIPKSAQPEPQPEAVQDANTEEQPKEQPETQAIVEPVKEQEPEPTGAKEKVTAPKTVSSKPATSVQPKKASGKATNAAKSALAATKKMGTKYETEAPAPTVDAPAKATEEKAKATEAKSVEPKAPKQEPVRYAGKWVIYKLILTDDKDNATEENYFFELRASNGERLLASEEYTSYAGAVKGIQTHKDNVKKGNFRIVLSKKGDYIFKLLTAKNTLLCTGANYKTLERCESAIASTKRFAETAVLQEALEELRIKQPVEEETEITELPEGYNGKWIISSKGNESVGVMYYFELFASNGEKLLTSEEYTTYEGAVNAVETHKTNIAKGNFRISITKNGDYLFKLLGGNGQLLCLGEHYKTRSRCESAVESVKRFSKSAPVLRYGETI